MLRFGSRAVRGSHRRSFSVGQAIRAEVRPVPPAAKPPTTPPVKAPQPTAAASSGAGPVKARSHGFRNFVLASIVLAGGLYGTGVYYALKDDQFHDIFVEYVPFSDDVVNYIEEKQFQSRYHDVPTTDAPSKQHPSDDKIVKMYRSGVTASTVVEDASARHISAKSPSQPRAPKPDTATPVPIVKRQGNDTKEAAAAKAPAPTAAGAASGLPLLHIGGGDVDPLVQKSVDSLNKLIQSVNNQSADSQAVSDVSKVLAQLSQSIHTLRNEHQQKLEQSLQGQANKFAQLGQAQAEEVKAAVTLKQAELEKALDDEEKRLISLYNSRLATEIEATKKAVIAHANNKLLASSIERERQVADKVSAYVDQERQGRLANLDKLNARLEELEALVASSNGEIDGFRKSAEFHAVISQLSNVITHSTEPVALRPYLTKLKAVAGDDAVVKAALECVPESVYDAGVLSPAQLTARFHLLEPELRKSSLLPPDAGIAGHVGSLLFSKLLYKKRGSPVGDDIESILARAETALGQGRVIDAVSEINSLKGWPRALARDWLAEARTRGEVEVVLAAIATEGGLK